jgi:hypothetical protein
MRNTRRRRMFRSKKFLLVGVSLVAMLAFVATAGASLNSVRNGDFQTGSLAPWVPFTTSSNGTNGTALPDVQSFDTTGFGASLAAHFNVGEVNFTGVNEGGGISQSFAGRGSYRFSADVAVLPPVSNQSCGVFELQVDGGQVDYWDSGSSNTGGCAGGVVYRHTLQGSVSFLTGGYHTVSIEIWRPFISQIGSTPDQYVDNISVVPKLARVG